MTRAYLVSNATDTWERLATSKLRYLGACLSAVLGHTTLRP